MKGLLPLGSVVLLKGANKRLMIIGRIQKQLDSDKVWDYSACYYPEGLINPDKTFLFDNDKIEKVYFLGFQDEEEIKFLDYIKGKLEDEISKRNSKGE